MSRAAIVMKSIYGAVDAAYPASIAIG